MEWVGPSPSCWAYMRVVARKFAWLSMQPLGRPVVPDV